MGAKVLTQPFVYGGVVNADLLALLGPLNGSVLDVGCGVGAWAQALRADGAQRLTGWIPQRWRWVTSGKSRALGTATRGASDPFLAQQIHVVARRA